MRKAPGLPSRLQILHGLSTPGATVESRLLRPETKTQQMPRVFRFLVKLQALAQERLEGYRLHVEQAREEIEALQVSPLHSNYWQWCASFRHDVEVLVTLVLFERAVLSVP